MTTLKEMEALKSKSSATVVNAKSILTRLADEKRVLTARKTLTAAQRGQLTTLNEKIKSTENTKSRAENDLRLAERLIPGLKAVEDIDKELQKAYDEYERLASFGETPSKSKINEILRRREEVARPLSGYKPEAPTPPAILSAKKTPTPGAPTGAQIQEPTVEPGREVKEPKVKAGVKTQEPGPGFDANVPGLKPTQLPMPVGDEKGKKKPMPIGGDVMAQAEAMYGELDEIFASDPELRKLLETAVKKEYTEQRFLSELERTNWWKSNAGPIRQRGFYKRQYEDLVNEIKTDDPNYQSKIEELNRTSEYGRGLENTVETVTSEWTAQYGSPSADDLITIRGIAENLYQYANENDATKIRNLVLSKPRTLGAGGVAGGALGANLQTLRSIASANGLDLDRDFGTSIQTWMDRIAKGESIETIKSVIRNAAKNTWGVNDRVAGLLDQGVDLATIYAPYKTRMANILEISPETVSFSDLASKGVIGGKEEKNLYEFERELRKDPRWQYTRNAATEVSNSALQVLKDFGFQG